MSRAGNRSILENVPSKLRPVPVVAGAGEIEGRCPPHLCDLGDGAQPSLSSRSNQTQHQLLGRATPCPHWTQHPQAKAVVPRSPPDARGTLGSPAKPLPAPARCHMCTASFLQGMTSLWLMMSQRGAEPSSPQVGTERHRPWEQSVGFLSPSPPPRRGPPAPTSRSPTGDHRISQHDVTPLRDAPRCGAPRPLAAGTHARAQHLPQLLPPAPGRPPALIGRMRCQSASRAG